MIRANAVLVLRRRLVAYPERIDGRRLVHLQAAAPKGPGPGEVGSRVEFRLSPSE